MHGFDRPWWIIGGWSLEAYSGISRLHEDMDISILSSDAEAFRPLLDSAAKAWLRDTIARMNPDHEWVTSP